MASLIHGEFHAMRILIAGVLALVTLTGCSTEVPHRVWVAVQVAKYVQSHGGDANAYSVYSNTSSSMSPTLRIGSLLLVKRLTLAPGERAPARGDIILFQPPIRERLRAPFIKRVIALPGDRFRIAAGKTYVNGHLLTEKYVGDATRYDMSVHDYGMYVSFGGPAAAITPPDADIPQRSAWTTASSLPPDCFLVLGDNRNDSEDSHIFGCVGRASMVGKVVQIYR